MSLCKGTGRERQHQHFKDQGGVLPAETVSHILVPVLKLLDLNGKGDLAEGFLWRKGFTHWPSKA